jgi:Protein of unknown function (DUF1757)
VVDADQLRWDRTILSAAAIGVSSVFGLTAIVIVIVIAILTSETTSKTASASDRDGRRPRLIPGLRRQVSEVMNRIAAITK